MLTLRNFSACVWMNSIPNRSRYHHVLLNTLLAFTRHRWMTMSRHQTAEMVRQQCNVFSRTIFILHPTSRIQPSICAAACTQFVYVGRYAVSLRTRARHVAVILRAPTNIFVLTSPSHYSLFVCVPSWKQVCRQHCGHCRHRGKHRQHRNSLLLSGSQEC